MKSFFRAISYIFNPLFVPVAGTLMYFIITPKYSPLKLQSGNILPIFILTVIIPIVCFLILKNLGAVRSASLTTVKERIYPVLIQGIILLMIILKVIANNYTIELHYYFLGLFSASLAILLLLLLGFKCSLHLAGMGSLLMFLIALSIHFESNVTIAISIVTLFTGVVATSMLYLRTHRPSEVLIGLFIGLISQLFTLKFWL